MACTLVLGKNRDWWKRLGKWFDGRQRKMEASASAQLVLVIVLYCFAVLPEAFMDLGGIDISRMIKSSANRRKHLEGIRVKGSAEYLSRAHTLMVLTSSNRDSGRSSNVNADEEVGIFSIGGHELCDGPFYNFARCGTWSYIVNTVIQGYSSALSAESASYSTVITPSVSAGVNDAIELVDVSPFDNVSPAPNGFEDNEGLLEQASQIGFGNGSFDRRYAGPVIKRKFNHTGRMPVSGGKWIFI